MKDFFQALQETPVLYVSRDAERALGTCQLPLGFFVLTNKISIQQNSKQIIGIKSNRLLSTYELLNHPKTSKILKEKNINNIVVFKPTKQIENKCNELGIKLLNPPANLASEVEEKISQVNWLGELSQLLPPHYIATLKNISWNGEPFIIQFNRAHTGSGTIFINSKKTLNELQNKFPNRPARVSAFIEGYTITNNNIVKDNLVLCGNISYQITGLKPFTNLPFATIGNDFALPNLLLNYEQKSNFLEIANKVGNQLQKHGWKGAFGIDVMVEKTTGKLYLLEINARQPASVTFESILQEKQKSKRNTALTTFEAHLLALLEQPLPSHKLIPLKTGSQIILRKQKKDIDLPQLQKKLSDYTTISYQNTEPESDLLRIQLNTGIMKDDGVFNEVGEKISYFISLPSSRTEL